MTKECVFPNFIFRRFIIFRLK